MRIDEAVSENTKTQFNSELDQIMWLAVAKFVTECGGNISSASQHARFDFADNIACWMVLRAEQEDGAE